MIRNMNSRGITVVVIVLGFLGVILNHKHLFFSDEVMFTVLHNDAPQNCKFSHRNRWGSNSRSSVPEYEFAGFCGAINTDMGHFKLPNEYYQLTLASPREELDRILQEGCKFSAVVVGYGPKPATGSVPSYPLKKTISKIIESHGCNENL